MNSISFYGGETSGSIGKQNLNPVRKEIKSFQEPKGDTVNFRSHDYYDYDDFNGRKHSVLSSIIKIAATSAIVVGGLGYVHKKGLINKIKNAKIKDFANKIAEPCHNMCTKIKDYGIQAWEKAQGWFGKK